MDRAILKQWLAKVKNLKFGILARYNLFILAAKYATTAAKIIITKQLLNSLDSQLFAWHIIDPLPIPITTSSSISSNNCIIILAANSALQVGA